MSELAPMPLPESPTFWAGGLDAVSRAVEAGLAEMAAGREPTPAAIRLANREAKELIETARRDGGFQPSLINMLQLVRKLPSVQNLQIIAGRLITEGGDRRHALVVWRSIFDRFPLSPEAFRLYVRLVLREHGPEAATALIDERFPQPLLLRDEAELLMLGYALEEIGRIVDAEKTYERLTRLLPGSTAAWRRLATLQETRGALGAAERTLSAASAGNGDARIANLLARVRRNIQTLEGLAPGGHLEELPMSVTALESILRTVAAERRARPPATPRRLGSTIFVGGSLGSGGAERQLVITTLALERAIMAGKSFEGLPLLGPVTVCCRSLNHQNGNDFFRRTLEDAGVNVRSYMDFEPYGGRIRTSCLRDHLAAIEFLPPRMREGVTQLADFLRDQAPDVVHIWQDGMIFATGLAALLAGVPRIVLSVRTLPPNERANRWKVELEPIYRALLAAPGVVICANSEIAARRYEAWLALPPYSVPVIHNGVAKLDTRPGSDDAATWEAFVAGAGRRGFTMGGIMRLDQNKRPLDWLDVAARVKERHPDARFVLVGDGVLRADATEYAARLGLRSSVLFTGRSQSVGHWLSKMDALLLTSRFEGTPNVLIEAQLAGVPVVTTPAGGAAETVIEGRTGFVLDDAQELDADQAAERIGRIAAGDENERAARREAARNWATNRYSVESMLEATLSAFTMSAAMPIRIAA